MGACHLAGGLWAGEGAHLLGLGDHHMAVHEDARDALRHARQDGGTWRGGGGISGYYCVGRGAPRTHGDVGHEVASIGRDQR